MLGSPHRMHAAVAMAFPELPTRDGSGPRVLWRVDRNSAAEVVLFVVSPTRPDLTHLVEQAGWPAASDTPGWQTYDYGAFLDRLSVGSTWTFRLTANPVNSIRRTVSLTSVTYDGRLTVTDPEALRRTLTQGLGKAKAYGCGLMTLAPVG
nr:type I-E CRISPR-associated protein Cas6/Cse3/CasE [Streptomyces sp. CBMA29]